MFGPAESLPRYYASVAVFASWRDMIRFSLALLFLTAASTLIVAGSADSASQDYYKGKTIRFIVAFSAGGTFDAYTRVIARHFGKHVPGIRLSSSKT